MKPIVQWEPCYLPADARQLRQEIAQTLLEVRRHFRANDPCRKAVRRLLRKRVAQLKQRVA